MAQIATVVTVSGNAFVVGLDGTTRALKVGDTIQKGETVRAAAGARVELLMEDGQIVAVAPEQNLLLDDAVAQTPATPTAQDAAVAPGTPDTVLQALEQGVDPTLALEATAAGAGAGGGGGDGSSFVRLLRIVEGVEPLAYEYLLGEPPTIDEVLLGAVPAPGEEVINTTLQVEEESAPGQGGNDEPGDGNYTQSGIVAWPGDAGGVIDTITVPGFAPVPVPAGGEVTIGFNQDGTVIDQDDTTSVPFATLTVSSDGSYTFTVLDGMTHGTTVPGENSLGLPPVILSGTSTTGVTVTANLTLVVQDDVPLIKTELVGEDTVPTPVGDVLQVNEDDLLAVRGAGESEGNDEAAPREALVVSGDIQDNVNWGADGFGRVTGVSWSGGGVTLAAGQASTTVYFDAAGQVQAGAAGAAASLLVNADGSYTFTLSDNLLVAGGGQNVVGLLGSGFTFEAVDADNDPVDGGIAVRVEITDDVPLIDPAVEASLPALTVGDWNLEQNASANIADLFSGRYGADGPGSRAISYSLDLPVAAVASGVFDTETGQQIYLYLENGSVVGHVGNTVDADGIATGPVAFVISISGTSVTLDQKRAVVHDDSTDPREDGPGEPTILVGQNLVTLVATIEDADGDTASERIDITSVFAFEDDGPTFQSVMDAVLSSATQVDFKGLYNADFGTDGLNFMSIALASSGRYANQDVTFHQYAPVNGVTKVDVMAGTTLQFSFYYETTTYAVSDGGDGSVVFQAYTYTDPADPVRFFNLTVNGDGTYLFDMISNKVISFTTVDGDAFTAAGPSGSRSTADGSLTIYGDSYKDAD